MNNLNEISASEEQIMSVLWKADEDLDLVTVKEHVNERFGHTWKIQTVATFLTRLAKKGYISIYKIGRYSHYKLIVSLDKYRAVKFEQAKELLLFDSYEAMGEFIKAYEVFK